MISLKEYLEIDEKKNRFELPISFFQKVIFTFLSKFFINYRFIERIYVDASQYKKLYWETLTDNLIEKLNLDIKFKNYYLFGKFFYYHTSVTTKTKKNNEVAVYGYGADTKDWETSLSKGIGEFLERFFLTRPSEDNLKEIKSVRLEEINENAKLVTEFHGFSKVQKEKYPGLNFDKNNKDKVVQALLVEDMVVNKKVYYPVQQIFRSVFKIRDEEGVMNQNTTSSGAGGFSLEAATISAIYEAVERDSFMCHFLTACSLRKINLGKVNIDLFYEIKNILDNSGFALDIFETTTDLGIFSCICRVKNLETGGITISGGANHDPLKAIDGALRESVAAIGSFDRNTFVSLPENYIPFLDDKVDRSYRLSLAAGGKYKDQFNFFESGGGIDLDRVLEKYNSQVDVFKDSKLELNFLLNKFKNFGNGYQYIYRFEVRNSILKSLDYFVVKIIIPKLYPLYLHEKFALTDSERLREFNEWKNKKRNFEINIFPHPFP